MIRNCLFLTRNLLTFDPQIVALYLTFCPFVSLFSRINIRKLAGKEAAIAARLEQKVARVPSPPPDQPPKTVHVGKSESVEDIDDLATVITQSKMKSAKIDTLQAELLQEKAKMAAIVNSVAPKRSRSKAHSSVQMLLRETLKNEVWRVMKFISSEKQMRLLASFTLKQANLTGKFDKKGQLTEEGVDFVEKHEVLINKMLNEHRSYCQTAMKDVCIAYMTDKNVKQLPPQEAFEKILRRDKDLDEELFIWWWTEYMPKAAGSARIWNKTVYYFGRLSDHAPRNDPKKWYITPSTEAWGAILIDNCRTRWPKLMDVKTKSSGRIYYSKSSKLGEKAGLKLINVRLDKDFVGKYTKVEQGARKYGGWSPEGLKKYSEYIKMNKEARLNPATAELEGRILEQIRERDGITGKDWADHKRQSTGGEAAATEVEEIDGLFDMADLGGI